MPQLLITFAWLWFCLGIISGALLGLGFHKPQWWGGYDSWRRRLARLGHISFFGTGFLALAIALTINTLKTQNALVAETSPLLGGLIIVGAVTMPTVCFLSSWRKSFRHAFVLPVVLLGGGVLWFTGWLIWNLVNQGWMS